MSLRGPVAIDWDCGRRGDPLADVARTWVLIRMGEPSADTKGRGLIRFLMAAYYGFHLRRYRQLRAFNNEELAAWQLPMVVLRLVRDNILHDERRRMMDYIERAVDGRMSG
jgi:aminoglycoside phosphotransferase (APT) family kinase protein